MNIVAYCRVSTNKEDQLNSLEVQKEFFEEFAKKNNHNLIKTYADEGLSGTKTKNRKAFQQMMKDSENKLFEMVVVKDISRLARNVVDFLQGVRYLKSHGIACKFVNANLDSEDSEMVLGVLALVAQEESANTSKRIKMSKKINAEKGRVPNIVFGYDKIIGDYFNLSINQKEADIVKKMYHMYLEDGYGASKIAHILNDEGIKTKRNNQWTQTGVIRVLTNEIYTGRVVNGREEVKDFLTGERTAKNECDWLITEKRELQIIDDKCFSKVQELLEQRSKTFKHSHERQSNRHLFSTLIKCADCGYSFRRRVRTYVNTYVDWICSGRNLHGTGSCTNKTTLYESDLIKAIEEYFAGLLKEKHNVIKDIVVKFNKLYKSKDDNKVMEKELRDKLKKLTRDKEKYMDMYVDEVIDREEMREKTGTIKVQIEKVANELKLVEYNLNKGDMSETLLAETFKNIDSVTSLETMTNVQLKKIIDKIIVDEHGNVDIHLKLLSDIGLDETYLISSNRT